MGPSWTTLWLSLSWRWIGLSALHGSQQCCDITPFYLKTWPSRPWVTNLIYFWNWLKMTSFRIYRARILINSHHPLHCVSSIRLHKSRSCKVPSIGEHNTSIIHSHSRENGSKISGGFMTYFDNHKNHNRPDWGLYCWHKYLCRQNDLVGVSSARRATDIKCCKGAPIKPTRLCPLQDVSHTSI